MLSGCGGGQSAESAPEGRLCDAFEGLWTMGCAINVWQVAGEDSVGNALARKHFNSVVAENCMKHESLQPWPEEWHWADADAFVQFAQDNKMECIGHCLVWHSQMAPWMVRRDTVGLEHRIPGPNTPPPDPVDEDDFCSADTLKARIERHVAQVVGRYRGRIKGWDVCNEMVEGDGSFRQSPYFKILGTEAIYTAFAAAMKADPEAELYLNDFSMDSPAKCQTYCALIDTLRQKGLRIDAIGMQSHMGIDYPDFAAWEASLAAYAAKGVKVMITEWEMSALPTVHQGANVADICQTDLAKNPQFNPYTQGLPDSVASLWAARVDTVFSICRRHADAVQRFNCWGITDAASWKNDYPIPGRSDYPLLFDRQGKPKNIVLKYLSTNAELLQWSKNRSLTLNCSCGARTDP